MSAEKTTAEEALIVAALAKHAAEVADIDAMVSVKPGRDRKQRIAFANLRARRNDYDDALAAVMKERGHE